MHKLFAMILLLLSVTAVDATPTITFSGSIDASNVMNIAPGSVSWTYNQGDFPTSVSVNGTAWNPSTQSTLSLAGPLLPSPLSAYNVTTQVLTGRDLCNAQIVGNEVLLYVDDTFNGASNYSAQISFTPKPVPAPSPQATLQISANIDGSDILQISTTGATWLHNAWGNPTNVTLNGIAWNTVTNPTLPNSGNTQFLPNGVDLSSIVFAGTGGDEVTYQLFPNYLDVYFADNQLGAGPYTATLSFGTVPEPSVLSLVAIASVTILRRPRGQSA